MLTENQYTLLQYLLHAEDYRPYSYYAKQLNVTERTVRNLLNSLEGYFNNNNIQVLKKHGHGIKLVYQNNGLNQVQIIEIDTSPQYRREKIKLFLLLNTNQKTSINELSAKFFVTKNSIAEDLKIIEEELIADNITLVKDNKGTSIRGKRKNIKNVILNIAHRFGTNFIFDNSQEFCFIKEIDKKIFTSEFSHLLRKTIDNAKMIFRYQFNEDYFFSFLINLMIDIHLFGINEPAEISQKKFKDIGSWFQSEIEEALEIKFNDSYNPARFTEYLTSFSLEKIDEDEYSSGLIRYADELVDIYCNLQNLKCLNRTEFIKRICSFLNTLQLRQLYRIKNFNPHLEYLMSAHETSFLALKLSTVILRERHKLLIESNDELGFLLFHFLSWSFEAKKKEQLIIVSQNGNGINNYLKKSIEEKIPNLDVIIKASKEENPRYGVETILFKKGNIIFQEDKIKQLDFLNPLQLEKLKSIFKEKLLEREMKVLKSKLKNNLYVERYIGACEKSEILKHISMKLADHGAVDKEFQKILLRNELLNPMVFGSEATGVSVFQSETVLQSALYVCYLPRMITWVDKGNSNRVDCVLILALTLSEEEYNIVKNLFQSITNGLKLYLSEGLTD